MYQVFQDGRPADNTPEGYPQLKYKDWNTSVFESFEEAELYANKWCYPGCFSIHGKVRKMEVNIPIDMGMGEAPVIMEIREIIPTILLQKGWQTQEEQVFLPDPETATLEAWISPEGSVNPYRDVELEIAWDHGISKRKELYRNREIIRNNR